MRSRNTEWTFGFLSLMSLCFFIVGGARAGDDESEKIVGYAHVVDGNVIQVGDMRVQFYGISAPRLPQTCDWPKERINCGEMALKAMRHLAHNKSIVCEKRKVEDMEGVFAVCRVDKIDVGAQIVRMGWAIADTRVSERYVGVEKMAKAAKRGLWHGEFVKPWEWDPNAPNISGAD